MANIKRYAVILLLGLALCGCTADEAATDSAGTEETVKEISPIEKNIIGSGGRYQASLTGDLFDEKTY